MRQYWHSRDRLTVQDELVLYAARIVIPKAIRHTTLEVLHSGYLGITKCRAKARFAIWWPKIGVYIQLYISTCQTCKHQTKDHAEPLIPTPLPDLP